MRDSLPRDFTLAIEKIGPLRFRLTASQILPLDQVTAFRFFEDPRNLFSITPGWLDFRMIDREGSVAVSENAEFDYTIRWCGIGISWRSKIIDYHPPECFTDTQLRGPYRSWVHRHTLTPVGGGTVMTDEVTYVLPLPAIPLHRFLIRKQLEDIFRYRAVKIDSWARRKPPCDAVATAGNHPVSIKKPF